MESSLCVSIETLFSQTSLLHNTIYSNSHLFVLRKWEFFFSIHIYILSVTRIHLYSRIMRMSHYVTSVLELSPIIPTDTAVVIVLNPQIISTYLPITARTVITVVQWERFGMVIKPPLQLVLHIFHRFP